MFKDIKVGNLTIGANSAPFIIAELSGNHNGKLENALKIVDAAAANGAHAIKLQTYTNETMTLDCTAEDFVVKPPSPWENRKLYELYDAAHTPWEWHHALFARAKELGIMCFSTPFDETAVDFLEKNFNPPIHKIASFECTDIPLIEKVARTGKPMIISTGLATFEEVEETVTAAKKAGAKEIILLKCTSAYPANPENANLSTIPDLREKFGVPVGLSDHTLGIDVSVASIGYGAVVIEKHFITSRKEKGVDSGFSIEPAELKNLRSRTEKAWEIRGNTTSDNFIPAYDKAGLFDDVDNAEKAVGHITYGASEAEKNSLVFRRSLYISNDIKKGEKFSGNNIRRVRPGYGLAPKYYDEIMGKTAARDASKGTRLSWDLVAETLAS